MGASPRAYRRSPKVPGLCPFEDKGEGLKPLNAPHARYAARGSASALVLALPDLADGQGFRMNLNPAPIPSTLHHCKEKYC